MASAESQLTAVLEIKNGQIVRFLNEQFGGANVLGSSPDTVKALADFSEAFA